MSQIDLVKFETNVFSDFYVFLGYSRGSQSFHAQGLRCSCNTSTYQFTTHLSRSLSSPPPAAVSYQKQEPTPNQIEKKTKSFRVFESHFGSLSPFAGMRLRHVRLPDESLSANSLIHAILGDQSICRPRYPRCDIGLVSSG